MCGLGKLVLNIVFPRMERDMVHRGVTLAAATLWDLGRELAQSKKDYTEWVRLEKKDLLDHSVPTKVSDVTPALLGLVPEKRTAKCCCPAP